MRLLSVKQKQRGQDSSAHSSSQGNDDHDDDDDDDDHDNNSEGKTGMQGEDEDEMRMPGESCVLLGIRLSDPYPPCASDQARPVSKIDLDVSA